MPTNPASPDSISFPGISSNTQDVWRNIIRNNLGNLNNSQTGSELFKKLEELRIPGIGFESIRRTAEWICLHNENIDLESDCFCLLSQATKKALRAQNITDDKIFQQWIAENLPHLSDKRKIEIIAYLNENVEQLTSKQK